MKDKDKDKKPDSAPDAEKKAEKKEEQAKPEPKLVPAEDLDVLSNELLELKDKYLRMLAETDNFKKRNAEELKREKQYASQPVADKLIDAIETFEQALSVKTDDPQFKNFLYGFRMIKDMIYNVLIDEGVKMIQINVGDPFDPNVAQAIDTSHDPTLPENVVLKVIKNGYKFKDRLLRPAMVQINIKPIPEPESTQPSNNEKLADNIA
ncbi:MAG TPA: nucleotide exchange factor GrpE [Acholeplasmatales bacterium]|nr:MAG: nucleotide exchange factor GrpE [Tenericutes bacterium GWF2_57_13]HAQ56778.1 nucleotide exchange factor GrpE [Acholeplasmatales bacterium]